VECKFDTNELIWSRAMKSEQKKLKNVPKKNRRNAVLRARGAKKSRRRPTVDAQ